MGMAGYLLLVWLAASAALRFTLFVTPLVVRWEAGKCIVGGFSSAGPIFGRRGQKAQAGAFWTLLVGKEETAHSQEKADLAAAAAAWTRLIHGHVINYPSDRREMQLPVQTITTVMHRAGQPVKLSGHLPI